MTENRRVHYRLVYPTTVRPNLLIGQATYPILDLSASGVKVLQHPSRPVAVGDALSGQIVFKNGGRESVEGFAIRAHGNAIIFSFTKGVSAQRMVTEQRLLIARFGSLIR